MSDDRKKTTGYTDRHADNRETSQENWRKGVNTRSASSSGSSSRDYVDSDYSSHKNSISSERREDSERHVEGADLSGFRPNKTNGASHWTEDGAAVGNAPKKNSTGNKRA